jgi:hypothetical protein
MLKASLLQVVKFAPLVPSLCMKDLDIALNLLDDMQVVEKTHVILLYVLTDVLADGLKKDEAAELNLNLLNMFPSTTTLNVMPLENVLVEAVKVKILDADGINLAVKEKRKKC